jgi:two-component system, LuxR family, sensor kinase FixL
LAQNANVQARGPDVPAQLLQSLPDPVIGCDAGGTVVYWSPAAEAAYGYPRDEALGRRAATLLHTRFPAPLLEIIEELGDLGLWQGRLEHRCKDGRAVVVRSHWAARRDGQGNVVGSVAVEREVEDEAAAPVGAAPEPDPRTGSEEVRAVDPELAALTHELNNALAIIINYTAFVTAELDAPSSSSGEAIRADLREIQAAAQRALEVTRRLAGEP